MVSMKSSKVKTCNWESARSDSVLGAANLGCSDNYNLKYGVDTSPQVLEASRDIVLAYN